MTDIPIIRLEDITIWPVVNYFDEEGRFYIGNPHDPAQLNAWQDWHRRNGWPIPEWPGLERDREILV